MFARTPIAQSVRSAAARAPRAPAGLPRPKAQQMRFQSVKSSAEQAREAEYAAQLVKIKTAARARNMTLLTAGLIFAAGAMGFASGSLINPSIFLSSHLIPSEEAIQLQESQQPKYGTADDYKKAIRDIRKLFVSRGADDRVSTDEDDLRSHGVSDWSYHEAELPTVVVWVESTNEVQEIVRIATKYRVPITPFSGGTSLEGHFASVSLAS